MTALWALSALIALTFNPDMSDGSALAKQVAAEYTQQTDGVVTFMVTTQSEVKSIHHTELSEAVYAYVNGKPVHKRYLKSLVGSKAAGPDALAKLSAEPEGSLSRSGMKVPINAAVVADFKFGKPREAGDLIACDFTSDVKDQSHGDGTFFVKKSGQLDHIHFIPNVMPEHVTGMTIEVVYGSVTADRWDVVTISRTFIGHRGALSGRVVSSTTYDRYHVFPNEGAARAAVDALPLAGP